jgi:hypothetical protein
MYTNDREDKEKMKTISIQYHFTLADGSQEIFDLQLDAKKLELLIDAPDSLPAWTHLSFHQCPNCSLTVETHPHCPLAANIVNIVKRFDRLLSYEDIHVEVVTEERVVSQDTTAQKGLSSLMGLVIANSGCPHTAFFRPMAHFHLPLANIEETICRAASMYLLAQYFLKQEGQDAELELKGLKKIYDEIHIVNIAIAERLRSSSNTDLSANAVILLDLYAIAFPFAIEKTLRDLHNLFRPFLMGSEDHVK